MAEKRMFSKTIVRSDAFLDLPTSTQCLFYNLGMEADDDGVVSSPRAVMRSCGASKEDLDLLIKTRYLLSFPSGIVVIKHWRMNNYIRKDRHKNSSYLEELSTLTVDERGAYTERKEGDLPALSVKWQPSDNQVTTKWQPSDCNLETQDRIGKDRIGKDRIGKVNNKPSDNPFLDILIEEGD